MRAAGVVHSGSWSKRWPLFFILWTNIVCVLGTYIPVKLIRKISIDNGRTQEKFRDGLKVLIYRPVKPLKIRKDLP